MIAAIGLHPAVVISRCADIVLSLTLISFSSLLVSFPVDVRLGLEMGNIVIQDRPFCQQHTLYKLKIKTDGDISRKYSQSRRM